MNQGRDKIELLRGAAWGWARLEQLGRDVRYGLRQVRRNPAFSGIAIATLALGSPDVRDPAVPLSRVRQARGVRQRGIGEDSRNPRRYQRGRDFENPADGNRPDDAVRLPGA